MTGIAYRTPGPWGPGSATNLTAQEIDQNFWHLLQRVIELETNAPVPPRIFSFSVSGQTFQVHLTDGRTLGPFGLPVARFTWRGSYSPGTTYQPLDLITAGTSVYLVLHEHAAPSEFDAGEETTEGPLYHQLFGAVPGGAHTVVDVEAGFIDLTPQMAGSWFRAQSPEGLVIRLPAGFPPEGMIAVRQGTAANAWLVAASGAEILPVENRYPLTNRQGAVLFARPVNATQWAVWGELSLFDIAPPTEPSEPPAPTEPATDATESEVSEPTEATETEPATEAAGPNIALADDQNTINLNSATHNWADIPIGGPFPGRWIWVAVSFESPQFRELLSVTGFTRVARAFEGSETRFNAELWANQQDSGTLTNVGLTFDDEVRNLSLGIYVSRWGPGEVQLLIEHADSDDGFSETVPFGRDMAVLGIYQKSQSGWDWDGDMVTDYAHDWAMAGHYTRGGHIDGAGEPPSEVSIVVSDTGFQHRGAVAVLGTPPPTETELPTATETESEAEPTESEVATSEPTATETESELTEPAVSESEPGPTETEPVATEPSPTETESEAEPTEPPVSEPSPTETEAPTETESEAAPTESETTPSEPATPEPTETEATEDPCPCDPEYVTGDRGGTDGIVVTSSGFTWGEGDPQTLVSGQTTYDPNEHLWASGWEPADGKSLTFEFAEAVKITEARIHWTRLDDNLQEGNHGSWQWQGSDDGTQWTDIGDPFTLGWPTASPGATVVYDELAGNDQGYRYYRLLGISGTVSEHPNWQEIEFRQCTCPGEASESESEAAFEPQIPGLAAVLTASAVGTSGTTFNNVDIGPAPSGSDDRAILIAVFHSSPEPIWLDLFVTPDGASQEQVFEQGAADSGYATGQNILGFALDDFNTGATMDIHVAAVDQDEFDPAEVGDVVIMVYVLPANHYYFTNYAGLTGPFSEELAPSSASEITTFFGWRNDAPVALSGLDDIHFAGTFEGEPDMHVEARQVTGDATVSVASGGTLIRALGIAHGPL